MTASAATGAETSARRLQLDGIHIDLAGDGVVLGRLRLGRSQLALVVILVALIAALGVVGYGSNERISQRTRELNYQLQRVSGDRVALERQVMIYGLAVERWLQARATADEVSLQRDLTARQLQVTVDDALPDPTVAPAMREVLSRLEDVDALVAIGRDELGRSDRLALTEAIDAASTAAKRLFDANEGQNFALVHELDKELMFTRRAQWLMAALVLAIVVVLYVSVDRIFRSNYRTASAMLRREHDRYSLAMAERMRAEHRYREVVDEVTDVVFRLDLNGRWTLLNHAWETLTGTSVEAALGRNALVSCHPDDRDRMHAEMSPLIDGRQSTAVAECRQLHADGATRIVMVSARSGIDDATGERYIAGTINDVTARVTAERLAHAQTEILELIATGTPTETTFARIITVLTPFAHGSRMTFVKSARLAAIPAESDVERIQLSDVSGGAATGELRWTAPGDPAAAGDTRIIAQLAARLGALAVERQTSSDRLAHQATHDQLTALPNRTTLTDRLETAAPRTRRIGAQLGVMFLDVDRFKSINDSLGHRAGDRLLVEVARRLSGVLRASDTVARFGGDEFVIIMENVTRDVVCHTAQHILDAVAAPIALDGQLAHVTTSIGIVIDDGHETADTVLKNADIAMYCAKHNGRARYEVFDDEMQRWNEHRQTIEADLRACVLDDELEVWYRPVINLETERLIGFEALVRWNRPGVGVVSPANFIGLAEEIGIITVIGEWVMNTALRQLTEWQRHDPELTMSINVSGTELMSGDFLATVAAALASTQVDPTRIVLEITESVLLDDVHDIPHLLARLRSLGLRLAIDDFGTGYSSLCYLRELPLDILKIDRTFVSASDAGLTDTMIVSYVSDLGHALGLEVIAEGIETVEQLAAMRAIGVDNGQGYLFGRPRPPLELVDYLAANTVIEVLGA